MTLFSVIPAVFKRESRDFLDSPVKPWNDRTILSDNLRSSGINSDSAIEL